MHIYVPPHLLSFAGSFTQEALGSCGWQRMIIIEVCNRDIYALIQRLWTSVVSKGGFTLTEFHVDVLIGVFLPELFIFIFVTHERENDFLAYGLEEIKIKVILTGM